MVFAFYELFWKKKNTLLRFIKGDAKTRDNGKLSKCNITVAPPLQRRLRSQRTVNRFDAKNALSWEHVLNAILTNINNQLVWNGRIVYVQDLSLVFRQNLKTLSVV